MPKDLHDRPPAPQSAPYTAYAGPPGKADILSRQLAALALIALLYTAAVPFTPIMWILDIDGSSVFDRLLAGIVMLSACYFQWRIAGLTSPLAVFLLLPGAVVGGETRIRNGRVERAGSGGAGFVWRPGFYWPCVVCEAVLLCAAEFGGNELLRRCVVCGVVAGLWLVGYHATPESTRLWAYERIKSWLFWMVLDEMMRVGGRSYNARRRRR
ncbi:hypothetical protein CTA2_2014 [Colletotrichum tanaceti]|uniref:Uncharacterized protein n=1 Tax=Colletotrichum tanaceti TaxID=1306861 RepID=A0A4U6X8Z4_9PEZI|nr:hypothetical protein CTA2_2014 [Colletotrichum tanaceti]TKW51573.1 hypothetical protein CTA1_10322 [Colletotrichum tanaceti]